MMEQSGKLSFLSCRTASRKLQLFFILSTNLHWKVAFGSSELFDLSKQIIKLNFDNATRYDLCLFRLKTS